ncbi:MAG: hypothetical protein ABIR57_05275 [Aeromicrobium sp.]
MSADDEVLRLRAEVAQAKLDALNAQLAAAEAGAGQAPTADYASYNAPPEAPAARPPSMADSMLSPAPRNVPVVYRLLLLPFSWWAVFTLFMVSVAPIIVWIGIPEAGFVMVLVTVGAIVGLRLRKHLRQLGLLKWGEVANVTGSELLDRGTYYSGMTYNNMRVPVAHGWKVDRGFYNGPGTKEKIHYSLNGMEGVLVMRGRGYEDGVILVDSRKPGVAMCVSSFPYDLDRDSSGNWTGIVGTKVLVGAFLMAAILWGWTVGALTTLNTIRGVTPQLIG